MRIRLVIPAALLVAAAYVTGRQRAHDAPRPMMPPACDISDEIRRRAEAEAADVNELLGEPSPFTVAVPSAEPFVGHAGSEAAATVAPPAPLAYITGRDDEWDVPEFPLPVSRLRTSGPLAPLEPVAVITPAVAPEPAVEAEAAEDLDLATVAEGAAPAAAAAAPEAAPDPLSAWATEVVAVSGAVPMDDALPLEPVGIEVEIDESGHFSVGGWASQAGHMAFAGVTFRDRRGGPVEVAGIHLTADGLVNVSDGGLLVLGDAGFAPDAEGFTIVVAAAGPGAFAATGRYELRAD